MKAPSSVLLPDIRLFGQPVVATAAPDRILMIEALSRLRGAGETWASPDRFIASDPGPAALAALDCTALGLARELLARRRDTILSVNVMKGSLIDWKWQDAAGALFCHPDICARLVIEVNEDETFLRSHYETLFELRRNGIRVALDDFGSGQTTTSDMLLLRPDFLKLDQHMITRGGRISQAAARALDLAAGLGLTVIAEGIETPAQAHGAELAGIGFLQGFLYARPGPLLQGHDVPRGLAPAIRAGLR